MQNTTQDYQRAIRNILQQYPHISRALLFGSRAKGTHRQGSDIDIALVGSGLDHRTLLTIQQQLDDLLLPVKIDLIRLDEITKPEFAEHIRRVGVDWL